MSDRRDTIELLIKGVMQKWLNYANDTFYNSAEKKEALNEINSMFEVTLNTVKREMHKQEYLAYKEVFASGIEDLLSVRQSFLDRANAEIQDIIERAVLHSSTLEEQKIAKLKKHLYENGFYELERVKVLHDSKKDELVLSLTKEKSPWVVALFDYLGFFELLDKSIGAKTKVANEVAKWLNVTADTIKKNRESLSLASSLREKNRYTAFLYIDEAKNYYESLK